jgi:hypothetical protein
MKVYLAAIVGYVPNDVVTCLGTFLEACYITRRQDIDMKALDTLDEALDKFKELREVFRVPGVRPDGFSSLPRMHSIFHYRRHIEDFGAPGGLCSSITESHHITAVKRPWRRSNRHQALGQMLLIIQHLDKLAAMRSDFTARGMLPGRHSANVPQVTCLDKNNNEDDEDDTPVEDLENVLGHVSLAQTHGTLFSLVVPLASKLNPQSIWISRGYQDALHHCR